MNKKEELTLELIATEIRDDIITMINKANSGHTSGSLSVTDLLVILYWGIRKKGDKIILSKGHAAPTLYAILSKKGYFERKHLGTLRQLDSILQGHPDMTKTPGIDFSSGCLGQGPAIGAGMAYALKNLKKTKGKVYVVMGDGELQEGSTWEAFSIISHNKLDNLCIIVDNNCLQIDGKVEEINSIESLEKRFQAFGFETKTINGHNYRQIFESLIYFKNGENKKPLAIIAKTIKGKGVKEAENKPLYYHGKPLTGKEYNTAKKELKEKINYLKTKLKKW